MILVGISDISISDFETLALNWSDVFHQTQNVGKYFEQC